MKNITTVLGLTNETNITKFQKLMSLLWMKSVVANSDGVLSIKSPEMLSLNS